MDDFFGDDNDNKDIIVIQSLLNNMSKEIGTYIDNANKNVTVYIIDSYNITSENLKNKLLNIILENSGNFLYSFAIIINNDIYKLNAIYSVSDNIHHIINNIIDFIYKHNYIQHKYTLNAYGILMQKLLCLYDYHDDVFNGKTINYYDVCNYKKE